MARTGSKLLTWADFLPSLAEVPPMSFTVNDEWLIEQPEPEPKTETEEKPWGTFPRSRTRSAPRNQPTASAREARNMGLMAVAVTISQDRI